MDMGLPHEVVALKEQVTQLQERVAKLEAAALAVHYAEHLCSDAGSDHALAVSANPADFSNVGCDLSAALFLAGGLDRTDRSVRRHQSL